MKIKNTNVWDELSKYFDTSNPDAIESRAADNILIAWPVIIDFVLKNSKNSKTTKILDFGCGAGGLCRKLNSIGFDVSGIDSSKEMINIARKHSGKQIDFRVSSSEQPLINEFGQRKFDVITSVMVFQFIEEIEITFKNLTQILNPNGYLLFAVFNPDFVKECLKKTYIGFRITQNDNYVNKFELDFGQGNTAGVYCRPSKEYDRILNKLEFNKLLEQYPEFTTEFINRYNPKHPTSLSEYMILGYQKK